MNKTARFLLKKDKFSISADYTDNFLWKDNDYFIMDNHRLAPWCWKTYFATTDDIFLFHIDQHTDDLGLIEDEIQYIADFDLIKSSLQDYRKLKMKYNDFEMPLIRWDNYLAFFNNYFHINNAMFAIHSSSRNPDLFKYYEASFFELPENIDYWIEKEKNVILNIDVDYFFVNDGDDNILCFSDEYIIFVLLKIKKLKAEEKIKVVTISMSPECCGGWISAIRILGIIVKTLELDDSVLEIKNST